MNNESTITGRKTKAKPELHKACSWQQLARPKIKISSLIKLLKHEQEIKKLNKNIIKNKRISSS